MAILKEAMKKDTPKRDSDATAKRDSAPKAAAPAREAQPAEGAAPGQEPATPEEQQAYEKTVVAGLKAIYDDKTHAGIVKMLGSGEPAESLAQTAATIMLELDKQSGGRIPEVVILPAAAELLGELATLAGTAKIFEVDERTVAAGVQRLVITLAQAYDVDPAELQSLIQAMPKEEIQRIVQEQQSYAQAGEPQQPTGAAPPPAGGQPGPGAQPPAGPQPAQPQPQPGA